jgi:hypothetical protein
MNIEVSEVESQLIKFEEPLGNTRNTFALGTQWSRREKECRHTSYRSELKSTSLTKVNCIASRQSICEIARERGGDITAAP